LLIKCNLKYFIDEKEQLRWEIEKVDYGGVINFKNSLTKIVYHRFIKNDYANLKE